MTYFNGPARNGAVFTNRTAYIRLIFYSFLFYFDQRGRNTAFHNILLFLFYFDQRGRNTAFHYFTAYYYLRALDHISVLLGGRGEVLTFVAKIFRNLQRYMTHEFGLMIWVLDRSKVYHPRKATIIITI